MVHDQDDELIGINGIIGKVGINEIIGKDTKIKKLIKENKRLKRKIKAMDSLWESWSKGIEDMIGSD